MKPFLNSSSLIFQICPKATDTADTAKVNVRIIPLKKVKTPQEYKKSVTSYLW